MDDNQTPGVATDGISPDIFSLPESTAHEATKLIFGDWLDLVFTDGGSGSATLVTHMAGYINFLAYLLITVIMSYVLIASVIKTASEGTVGGKGWSMVWLPLRTFLATFLIFPVGIGQASSISFIQVSVAWLGSVGSNAADRVAEFVVKNLEKRAFSIETNINGYRTVMDMTEMAFCASGFNEGLSNYDKPADFYGEVSGISNYSLSNTTQGSLNTISRKKPLEVPIDSSLAKDFNSVNIGHKGKCGNITVQSVEGYEDTAREIMEIALKTQVKLFEQVSQPIAKGANATTYKNVLQTETLNSAKSKKLEKIIYDGVGKVTAIMDEYENEVSSLLIEKMGNGNELVDFKRANDLVTIGINQEHFGDKGWAYLGSYYTLLSSTIGTVNDLSKTAMGITTSDNVNGCKVIDASRNIIGKLFSYFGSDDEDEVCGYTEVFDSFDFIKNTVSDLNKTSGNLDRMVSSSCSDKNDCDVNLFEKSFSAKLSNTFTKNEILKQDSDTSSLARSTIGLLGWGGNNPASWGIKDAVNDSDSSNDIALGALYISDPITYTAALGKDIVYTAQGLRFTLKMMSGISEAASNVRIPVVAVGAAFLGGILTASIDFLSTILTIIYAQASAMAYFIPIVPALIWGMAFISWLLMFAEAIFNAPLAVTLMATPEGEGIAGSRMERKIAMIAALVLKPTMLVIGLILSMMILGIGFVFLNQIFWMAAGDSTGNFDPIGIVALITVWFTIMTVFMHNTFKIIPTFADNSLEWFLGGMTNKFGNDLDNNTANEFKGAQGSTSSLGEMTGSSVGMFSRSAFQGKGKNSSNNSGGKNNK